MYRIGRFRLYTAILIILFVESNILSIINVRMMVPNFMLIFVIFVGLNSDWREVMEAGIVGGLLRGALTTGSVGINVTVLSLCGLFATYCKNKVYRDNFLTQIALTMAMAVAFNTLSLFTKVVVRNVGLLSVDIQHRFAATAVFASFYTSLFAPPAFFCLKKLLRVRKLQF